MFQAILSPDFNLANVDLRSLMAAMAGSSDLEAVSTDGIQVEEMDVIEVVLS